MNGKRATTHWRYTDALRARYPSIRVEPDVLEGRVFTLAGSQRVFAAQRQLESTRHGNEQVAESVGFTTAQTLRLHFRRVLHTSPNAYRRRFATTGRARSAR